MDKLIRYFDLASEVREKRAFAVAGGKERKPPNWIPQYVALLFGVVLQPLFAHYQMKGVWEFHGLLGWILFAAIVAVIIFPAVYKNSFDPEKPIVVQFCTIFAGGMGWESFLKTAVKVAAGGT